MVFQGEGGGLAVPAGAPLVKFLRSRQDAGGMALPMQPWACGVLCSLRGTESLFPLGGDWPISGVSEHLAGTAHRLHPDPHSCFLAGGSLAISPLPGGN